MALKDWEKTGDTHWIKRIKGSRIIEKSVFVDINFGDQDIVDIEHFQNPSKDERRVFKTKSQALKFAKSYMKKH